MAPRNDVKDPSLFLEMKVYLGFLLGEMFWMLFGSWVWYGFCFVCWDILHGDRASGHICNIMDGYEYFLTACGIFQYLQRRFILPFEI